ncbi:MAG: ATP-binding protein [Pirellulaceae bacterium]
MQQFFAKLFDTADFPARWYCGNWSDFHGWLHIVSDVAIWGAYFGIPISLIYFARKRSDVVLPRIVYLFAAFILACGTTHLIEAVIFWNPIYRISALAKLFTASVSWVTLLVIIRYLPIALSLPSLAATNQKLQDEMEQRLRKEMELRAANARHNALLEGTRSIVWTTDAEGRFSEPQPSWQRYTGQDWNAHQGMGWANVIHEADRDSFLANWKRATSTREKYYGTGRIWNEEHQAWRQFVAEGVPVFSHGKVSEWVGTISDIEEQHQAEVNLDAARSNLARQNRELELIYQAAPVGMSLVDRDLKFLRINETLARINGIAREEHIGRRLDDLLSGLSSQIAPLYERVFATAEPVIGVEIVGTRPADEHERTWLVSYYPLQLESDSANTPAGSSVTAVSSIVQDITDRKQTEERLRQSEQAAQAANRSKSEFLANMSHEIRTPMAAVLGYADVLLNHLEDPDNRNCVLIIKRNGQHLLELINDILDLSRIEAGKMDIELETFDLPQLVGFIESLMQVRVQEKGISFDVVFEGKVPETIHTDPTRVRQVLINLIGNAIKFTEKGYVRLTVRLIELGGGPAIEFVVQDTGIGMSEEQRQRLFKPFSQGDSSVTRQYGGSGLGLAISRRLVEMLHGEMDLESQLGDGSTFFVRLPIGSIDNVKLIDAEAAYERHEEQAEPTPPRALSCRVLVVDDRRDVRHISQHFLEKAGATVATAEDGRQCIDIVLAARDSGDPFDLILMDMQMPNMDGLHATAELRSAGIQRPIIALTADAMKGDRDKCLSGGCDDYLSKPIDHAALIEMVGKYTQDLSLESLKQQRARRAQMLRARLKD